MSIKSIYPKLVLLGDYSDNQKGYDAASEDGAVYIIDLDTDATISLYNIAESVSAVCNCLGGTVAMGVVRDGFYMPLRNIDIQKNKLSFTLDTLFNSAMITHRQVLRAEAVEKLHEWSESLNIGVSDIDKHDQHTVDHCIDCLEQNEVIRA